ncbi:Neurogenic locus notch-like protein 1 [Leptotrombidium deliense]|uniref:Neurogenic locus notch-like protein 1 n=1 Tax=Leptotrombidium deliense TaxID=299467 RepID=A0A443ST80_9ACAR|nr:Neurogenic locus notch-like protein 1 [Leptotrombidium deliense]
MRKGETPPLDEAPYSPQYLRLSNDNDYTVKLKNVEFEDVEFTGMEVSMRYWTRWKGTDGGPGVFELAVIPCNATWPQTMNPPLINGGKTWQEFKQVATDKEGEWNFKFAGCRDNFKIVYTVKKQDLEPLVAIKDLKITYKYKKPVTEPPTTDPPTVTTEGGSAEQPTTGNAVDTTPNTAGVTTAEDKPSSRRKRQTESEETLTKHCLSAKDCDAFVTKGQWSIEQLPPLDDEIPSYRIPSENKKQLNVTVLVQNATTDVCVPFKYWVTNNSRLVAQLTDAKEKLTFGTTTQFAKDAYSWYDNTICVSYFVLENNDKPKNYTLTFEGQIPKEKKNEDIVAINIDPKNAVQKQKQNTSEFLSSWKKSVNASKQWNQMPLDANVWTKNDKPEEPLSYKLTLPPYTTKGFAYLQSHWFEYNENLKLRYTITPSNVSAVNVSLLLMNSQYEQISSTRVLTANYTKDNTSTAAVKDKEVEIVNSKAKKGDGHLVMFKVEYDLFNSTKNEIIFSNIDLSDGCRDETCSGNGTCVNKGPNNMICECKKGYTGSKCELIDFCNYTNVDKDGNRHKKQDETKDDWMDGNKYCSDRQGKCENTVSDFKCKCKERSYWDATKKICETIEPCDGVICSTGERCRETESKQSECVCKEGYKRDTNSKKCVQVDPCGEDSCGEAECMNENGRAQCYCKNIGFTYNKSNKKCEPPSECSVFVKESLGCHHTCVLKKGQFECACYAGYELDSGKKNCIQKFETNLTCGENEVVVKVTEDLEECRCRDGYYRDDQKKCSVHFCKEAEKDNKLKNMIKSICGTDKCEFKNAKILCECAAQYERDEKTGLCKLKTPCLDSNAKACDNEGEICIPDMNSEKKYKCECPVGTTLYNKKCVGQCDAHKDCYYFNARCKPSYERGVSQPKCECRPGFYSYETNENKFCEIAEHHHKLSFNMRLYTKETSNKRAKRSLSSVNCQQDAPLDVPGCVKYLEEADKKMEAAEKDVEKQKIINVNLFQNISDTFSSVFGSDMQSVSILDATTKDGDTYAVTMTVQFKRESKDPISVVNALKDSSAKLDNGYCFIPPSLVVENCDIKETDLDFCNEKSQDYCSDSNVCRYKKNFYSCHCKPGFQIKLIAPLSKDTKIDELKQITREFCEDIDECKLGYCNQPGEECINLVGSYRCFCKHGYKYEASKCQSL